MKIKLTLHTILLCLLIIILPLHAQNPTYEACLMNGIFIYPNHYEFDIYVKRTGSIPFEVYGLQHCLIFNNEILNGGTPTIKYIPGTSEMNAAQEPTNTLNATFVQNGYRVIKIPAKISSGPGFGTIISAGGVTGRGTRIGRFRITTTASAWAPTFLDLNWNFDLGPSAYATKYQAYVNGLPIDITIQSYHYNRIFLFPFISYSASLVSDSLVNPNIYEFDVYLKSTGYDWWTYEYQDFYVYSIEVCFLFNNSIKNGGIISSSYMPGTSEMSLAQVPDNPSISSYNGEIGVWKLAPKIASFSSSTNLSHSGNGTRLGRFRITTSAPSFSSTTPNVAWNFNSLYGSRTIVKVYGSDAVNDSVTVTMPWVHYNNLSNPILPIELVYFTSNLINSRDVELSWSTATETNNYGFEVERKCLTQTLSQGEGFNDWEKIGFVNGSGNSSSIRNYSYIDNTLTGGSKFAYRLKQIDHDGTFSLSSIQTIELELKDYVLSQNYPNPFNPTTTIEYTIPQAGQVVLSIYNLLGEKVDEVLNEHKEIGIYRTEYKASKLTSGVYVYVLRSNGNTISKKMIVLR